MRRSAASGGIRSASPAPRSSTPTAFLSSSCVFCGIRASTYSGRVSKRLASWGKVVGLLEGCSHRVLHPADAEHLHFYHVAGLEGPDSRRRPRTDEVTGLERHDVRDVGQHER